MFLNANKLFNLLEFYQEMNIRFQPFNFYWTNFQSVSDILPIIRSWLSGGKCFRPGTSKQSSLVAKPSQFTSAISSDILKLLSLFPDFWLAETLAISLSLSELHCCFRVIWLSPSWLFKAGITLLTSVKSFPEYLVFYGFLYPAPAHCLSFYYCSGFYYCLFLYPAGVELMGQ